MNEMLSHFGLLLVITAFLGYILHKIRFPLIIAYILSGFLVQVFFGIQDEVHILYEFFSTIGISFLLFLVGMELNFKEIRTLGKETLIIGFGQVVVTTFIGVLTSLLIGFGFVTSIYLGLALTFSSTIIVVKLLNEKKDITSLYGKITLGILLIQDFVALIILSVLSGLSKDSAMIDIGSLLFVFVKVAAFVLIVYVIARLILRKLLNQVASSGELLILCSIAWCFAFVLLSIEFGLSLELGAFIAGIGLSSSAYRYEIAGRLKPMRDFFILLFFVILGSQLDFSALTFYWFPALVLSLFVLIGNPIILLLIMKFVGHSPRTSFLVSISVAQISEFSLVLVILGQRLGHIDNAIVSLVVLIGSLTIVVSALTILYGQRIYHHFVPVLSFFGSNRTKKKLNRGIKQLKNHVIVAGYDRAGKEIVTYLKANDIPFVVVDFDPDKVADLLTHKYPVIFGDITDEEILDMCRLDKAVSFVSTVPDPDDNLVALYEISKHEYKVETYFTAVTDIDSMELKRAGANHVVIPALLGGKQIVSLLKDKLS